MDFDLSRGSRNAKSVLREKLAGFRDRLNNPREPRFERKSHCGRWSGDSRDRPKSVSGNTVEGFDEPAGARARSAQIINWRAKRTGRRNPSGRVKDFAVNRIIAREKSY